MRLTDSAQWFLQAMAQLTWQDDDLAFEPSDIRAVEQEAEAFRQRRKAAHLGVTHLEAAFRDIYRGNDYDGAKLQKIRTKAEVLVEASRQRNAGTFVPYETGGGYVIKPRGKR